MDAVIVHRISVSSIRLIGSEQVPVCYAAHPGAWFEVKPRILSNAYDYDIRLLFGLYFNRLCG